VGSSENVFVEAQDYSESGGNLNVRISVKNYPKKDREILSKTVTLTGVNNHQILTDIKVRALYNAVLLISLSSDLIQTDFLFSRSPMIRTISRMILWRSSMCIYKLSFLPKPWRKWSWSHSRLDIYLYRQTSPSTRLLAQVKL